MLDCAKAKSTASPNFGSARMSATFASPPPPLPCPNPRTCAPWLGQSLRSVQRKRRSRRLSGAETVAIPSSPARAMCTRHTVDGCKIRFAPRKKPWNVDSPQIPTNNGVSWLLRWCEMDFVHLVLNGYCLFVETPYSGNQPYQHDPFKGHVQYLSNLTATIWSPWCKTSSA